MDRDLDETLFVIYAGDRRSFGFGLDHSVDAVEYACQ